MFLLPYSFLVSCTKFLNIQYTSLFLSLSQNIMRTRNGCVYPRTSMAMELDEPESEALVFDDKTKKRKSMVASLDSKVKGSVRRRVTRNEENERIKQSADRMAMNEDETKERNQNRNGNQEGFEFFDELPDDLIISILGKLSGSATSPSDLFNARLTCKRFNNLGQDSLVLAKSSLKALFIPAKKWSDSAHQFLKRCCDAGNTEACYILGMIEFYCMESRKSGAALMAKAAMASHPSALYSLAVIQFNGSGGSKSEKNLRAGVTLCARAASLGHVDALRELGHCLQDGYGIRRHVGKGRRLIIQANVREFAPLLSLRRHVSALTAADGPVLEPPHPANQFLAEWFGTHEVKTCEEEEEGRMELCSYPHCGRVETRRHEFRRCSVCGKVKYCSRACQAMDWRRAHKPACEPPAGLEGGAVAYEEGL
ncbi:hypothetical protein LUZ60_002071 [Juncus effusus]|nr:hypothetical protein LUZ60_002071 [Juncus effusus]